MYTYKLGGMLITDELYHDDLEAVTFGRKDQNELMHYGIKGQSWGKRRFQNEDGSLTMAGRNRYDVGAPLTGTTAANMSKNLTYKTWNGSSNGYGGAGGGKSIPIHKQTFAKSNQLINTGSKIGNAAKKVSGYNVKTNTYTTPSVRSSVVGSTDAGKKAADNIFGRIGNWASNAAKDVGNAATSAYNDASKFVNQAGQDISRTAGNVGNTVSGAFNDAKNWAGNAYNDASKFVNQAGQDISRTAGNVGNAVSSAAKDVGNLAGQATNDAKNWVSDRAQDVGNAVSSAAKDVGNAASSAYNDASKFVNQAGQDISRTAGNIGNAAAGAFNDAKNWVGDRAQDVGKAATNAYNDASKAVTNAANDVGEFFTGKQAEENLNKAYAENRANGGNGWEDGNGNFDNNLRDARNAYDRTLPGAAGWVGDNLRENVQYPVEAAIGDVYNGAKNWATNAAQDVGNWVGDRAKDVGEAATGAARDVGDWASNAASDVRDWGAGALNKGRQAFESLFGRSEPPVPTLSDPNPQIETETILRENIIPEQRITEQRIPEQRITEQRVPEQRITENRIEEQRMAEKQAPGGFNSRPLTKEENEIELKRVNDRLNNIDDYYDHLRANNNPQWSNFTKQDVIDLLTKDRDRYQNKINQQQEAERARALSDKPDGVSDEYWREYTFNGGTRDSYDREMSARKNSQNNQNSSSSRQEVVGTVDTSRPHHFTYDPASGQTIVVYDDEKRR
jgi:hypothetical protein